MTLVTKGGRPNHAAMKTNSHSKLLIAKQRVQENDRRRNGASRCQELPAVHLNKPALSVDKGVQPSKVKVKGDGSIAGAEPLCIHHWKIADVEGPTSKGYCLKCEATKTFPNTIYDPNFSKPSFSRRPIGRHQEIVLPGSRPFGQ